MKPEIIAIISALGGVFISVMGNIIISIISKNHEYKKDLIKLTIATGLDEWKESVNFALKRGGKTTVYPPICYILFNSRLLSLLSQNKLNETELRQLFIENDKILKLIEEYNQIKEAKTKERGEGGRQGPSPANNRDA